MRGTVVDERGQPIADVTVFLAHPGDSPGVGGIEEFFQDRETMEFWSAAAPAARGRGRVLRTDDEGRFEFKVTDEEKRRLVVWHPDWQVKFVAEVPSAGATIVIELQRHVRIAGEVIEAAKGRRLEGISLALYEEGRNHRSSRSGLRLPASSSSLSPTGSYRFVAYGDGYVPSRGPAGYRHDEQHLIDMTPVERVELTLVDAEGAPWTGERWSAHGFDAATIEFATTAHRARSRIDLRVDMTTSRLQFDPITGKVTGGARSGVRSLRAWVGDSLIGSEGRPCMAAVPSGLGLPA